MSDCFPETGPEELLVSYALFISGNYSDRCYEEKVQIRFLFEQFTRKYITPYQLKQMADVFGPEISTAADKLIMACLGSFDQQVMARPGCLWSEEETLLLLARLFLRDDVNRDDLLPGRSIESRRRRITRVVHDLREHGLLQGQKPGPVLTIEEMPPVTIGVVDGRSLPQHKRLSQGMRCMKALHDREISARMERARLYNKIKRLESVIKESEDPKPYVLDEETKEQESLCRLMLDECTKNLPVPVNGRRYSDITYDLCELIRATSRKAYRILRAIMPLPCETSLYNRFSQTIAEKKKGLVDTELDSDHLHRLLENEEMEGSPVTIGIDAFSFKTFGESRIGMSGSYNEQYSNAFLFLHIPLDADKPPVPICLEKKGNGAYSDSTAQIFDKIKEIYQEKKIPIWFKATDGDRYLTAEHDAFFTEHVEAIRDDFTMLIQTLHDKLCDNLTMPIADPLHFTKNIRGKLLDHEVAVVDNDDLIMLVNMEMLAKVLDLGDAIMDHSHLGRMRDVYVTKLFTLDNVCKLLEAKNYPAALVFLPYSCIFALLYATNITNQTRLFLAKLAYLCFNRLLDEAQSLVENNSPQIKHRFSAGVMAVTMAEPSFLKRMMHSCLSFGISLLFGPRRLRLDSLGTHLVENTIGVARSTANSTRFELILSAFASAELRKELAKKYGIKLRVSKRVNDGGAKVDTLADEGVSHPECWDPHDIVSMFIEACDHELMAIARTELAQFLDPLKEFIKGIDVSELPETSEVANALIIERTYKFKCEHDASQ